MGSGQHPRDAGGRFTTRDALDEIPERELALAGHDQVDVGEVAQRGAAHRTLAVRATQHDRRVRSGRLDPPRQRQRGHVLLEDAREAHDDRVGAQDTFEGVVEVPIDDRAAVEQMLP